MTQYCVSVAGASALPPIAGEVDGSRSRHRGAKVWFPSRTMSKRSQGPCLLANLHP